MKKIKHLIIISCISLGVVSTIFVAKDLANDIKNKQEHNNISVEENNISNENSNKVYDLDKELENNKDEFSKDIIIEKGFKTSITNGNSDEEIKKNNFLLDTNKFSLDERIKAKNVAENFVQAIESFDIENIKETDRKSVV